MSESDEQLYVEAIIIPSWPISHRTSGMLDTVPAESKRPLRLQTGQPCEYERSVRFNHENPGESRSSMYVEQ